MCILFVGQAATATSGQLPQSAQQSGGCDTSNYQRILQILKRKHNKLGCNDNQANRHGVDKIYLYRNKLAIFINFACAFSDVTRSDEGALFHSAYK